MARVEVSPSELARIPNVKLYSGMPVEAVILTGELTGERTGSGLSDASAAGQLRARFQGAIETHLGALLLGWALNPSPGGEIRLFTHGGDPETRQKPVKISIFVISVTASWTPKG